MRRYRVTFVVLGMGVMSFGVLQSLMLPILPTVQEHFGTSQSTVTWVLTAYLLSASVATPLLGRVGDLYGKDRILFATLLCLCLGCVIAALAPTIEVLILARAVQGVGGGVLPLTFGILRDEAPPERVGGAIGAAAGLLAFGGGLGAVITGPIADLLSYQWLFWFGLLVLVPSAVAVRLLVPPSPVRHHGSLNWTSAALLSSGLLSLLLGISQGPVWGWGSARTAGLLLLSGVLLCCWVVNEVRANEPLIDMRLMRLPPIWTTNLAAALFGVGQFTIVAFLPAFVQADPSSGYGFGSSLTESCLFLLPQTAFMFVFGVLSGRLIRLVGAKWVMVAGTAVCVVPYVVFASAPGAKWQVYAASALLGVSMGLTVAATASIVVESVPATHTGVASGVSANMRTVGGCIGAAVMSTIVAGGLLGSDLPSMAAWRHGFLFLATTALLATVVASVVPVRRSLAGRRGLVPAQEAA